MSNFKPHRIHLGQRWISGRVGFRNVTAYFDRSGRIINDGKLSDEIAAEIEAVYRKNAQMMFEHLGVDSFEAMARRFAEI
jgi:hypothetical protein